MSHLNSIVEEIHLNLHLLILNHLVNAQMLDKIKAKWGSRPGVSFRPNWNRRPNVIKLLARQPQVLYAALKPLVLAAAAQEVNEQGETECLVKVRGKDPLTALVSAGLWLLENYRQNPDNAVENELIVRFCQALIIQTRHAMHLSDRTFDPAVWDALLEAIDQNSTSKEQQLEQINQLLDSLEKAPSAQPEAVDVPPPAPAAAPLPSTQPESEPEPAPEPAPEPQPETETEAELADEAGEPDASPESEWSRALNHVRHYPLYLGFVHETSTGFCNFYVLAMRTTGDWSVLNETARRTLFPDLGNITVSFPGKKNIVRMLTRNSFYVFEYEDRALELNTKEDALTLNISHRRMQARVLPELVYEGRFSPSYQFDSLLPMVYCLDGPLEFNRLNRVDYDPKHRLNVTNWNSQRAPRVLLADGTHCYGPLELIHQEDAVCVFVKAPEDGIVPCYSLAQVQTLEVLEFSYRVENTSVTHRLVNWNPARLKLQRIDMYDQDDQGLLGAFVDYLERNNYPLTTLKNLRQYARTGARGFLTGDAKFDRIRRDRLDRILTQLLANRSYEEHGVSLVKNVVMGSAAQRDPFFEKLMGEVLSTPSLAAQLPELQAYQQTAQALEQRISQLEAKNKKAEQVVFSAQAMATIEQLTEQLSEARAQLEQSRSAPREPAQLENTLEKFAQKMQEHLNDPAIGLNGVIAHKVIKAQSQREQSVEQTRVQQRLALMQSLPATPMTRSQCVQYLIGQVQRYRPDYGQLDILNLLICLTQGFLTIFSGDPGSGKTSICTILANVLGLNNVGQQLQRHFGPAVTEAWSEPGQADRFLSVSVERGWTSKRDFLGYFNPLSGRFETPDAKRYQCFVELDAEARARWTETTVGRPLPYMVLLDEANLSPLEYYWADFMNTQSGADVVNTITLGDSKRYCIPETLRFVATVNNDFTGEALSPRLLDRAWIIRLPQPSARKAWTHCSNLPEDGTYPDVKIIDYACLKQVFGAQSQSVIDEATQSVIFALFDCFDAMGHPVSQRSIRSVHDYLSAALEPDCFGRERALQAVDYVVIQKLLPSVSGSGPSCTQAMQRLLDVCTQARLEHSARCVQRMIECAQNNGGYFNFFDRAEGF